MSATSNANLTKYFNRHFPSASEAAADYAELARAEESYKASVEEGVLPDQFDIRENVGGALGGTPLEKKEDSIATGSKIELPDTKSKLSSTPLQLKTHVSSRVLPFSATKLSSIISDPTGDIPTTFIRVSTTPLGNGLTALMNSTLFRINKSTFITVDKGTKLFDSNLYKNTIKAVINTLSSADNSGKTQLGALDMANSHISYPDIQVDKNIEDLSAEITNIANTSKTIRIN